MLKVIITHDVDHLFRSDHYCDLIYPKLWVRESLSLLSRKITLQEWYLRLKSTFTYKRHYIDELMAFDSRNNVDSTFFFGMAKGLGMSYKASKAIPVIKHVMGAGFDVGVHGIAYDDYTKICMELNTFRDIVGEGQWGIREHYVRFNQDTFMYLAKAGYVYDSTEFDKTKGYLIKKPYKIERMWEFPLTIMDGYLPYSYESAKRLTLKIIEKAEKMNVGYITVLFHDRLYNDAFKAYKLWYEWLINYIIDSPTLTFCSFREAMEELNQG